MTTFWLFNKNVTKLLHAVFVYYNIKATKGIRFE